MELLIVRHAIAVDRTAAGQTDEQRPLTREGLEKFQRAARGLAQILEAPDVLLTSPLVRARQTAEIAARAWDTDTIVVSEALAGGSPAQILAAVHKHLKRSRVALFGHEPDLSALLAHLLSSRHSDAFTFKKGGAALVELDREGDCGRLLWFVPPRVLCRIGKQ